MAAEPVSPHRLHPASLLFDAGRRILAFAAWAVAVLFFAARSEERWYLLLLLPPFVEAVVRFFSFRYAFEAEQLVVREGLFVRSVRHVPYAHIQNIDTVQGPLHRLFGVVEVRMETAAGESPEAVFRVISSARLVELRQHVFGQPAEARSADEGFGLDEGAREEGAEAPFFRMGNGDLFLFGLLQQRGLVLAGGAFVALREFGDWDELGKRFAPQLEWASAGARGIGPLGWGLLALALFLVLQAGSVLWAFLTLYGFRIERRGEDLRSTCGLLTHQTASLPRARVQFLDVSQSWLQRGLRRVSVRALSAGGDSTRDSQVARKWLVPLCPRRVLSRVLSEVQPEASFDEVRWRGVHPRALRRLFVRWLLLLGPPALGAWWHSPAAGMVACLLAPSLALLFATLRRRALGWSLGSGAVFLRDGLFARRMACVRFEKVQSISLHRTPFDRRSRMARLRVDTAGASGTALHFTVPYLGLREARGLQASLEREAAARDFRW